jgi:hypothetical protein
VLERPWNRSSEGPKPPLGCQVLATVGEKWHSNHTSGVASNLAEMHCEICISQGPELDIFLMLVMFLMMSLLSCNTTLHTSLHCGL